MKGKETPASPTPVKSPTTPQPWQPALSIMSSLSLVRLSDDAPAWERHALCFFLSWAQTWLPQFLLPTYTLVQLLHSMFQYLPSYMGIPSGSMVENPPTMQETSVQSLG